MPYQLQRLRELIDRHPERAGSLLLHVESLERSIESLPLTCLANARTMFEAAQSSLCGRLNIPSVANEDFPQTTRRILRALDLSLQGHPQAAQIEAHVKRLLGSISGAASALAELSNIPNLRHGGALDLPTLERHHAYMLGGLCDALVSFLLDVARSRPDEAPAPPRLSYDDNPDFNATLDGEQPPIEVAGGRFQPGEVLFKLDPILYETALAEWRAERKSGDKEEPVAA